MKVLKPIVRIELPVKSFRLYIKELGKELDSSIERNESPRLLVKKVERNCLGRSGEKEIELVMMGDYHLENLNYYQKPLKEWKTFGAIYLSPRQALRLSEAIIQAVLSRHPLKPEGEERHELSEFL